VLSGDSYALADVAARGPGLVRAPAGRHRELRHEHPVVAALRDRPAHVLLGEPAAVYVGGVDGVDAGVEGRGRTSAVCCLSTGAPKVLPPTPITETLSPERPSCRYSNARPLATAPRARRIGGMLADRRARAERRGAGLRCSRARGAQRGRGVRRASSAAQGSRCAARSPRASATTAPRARFRARTLRPRRAGR